MAIERYQPNTVGPTTDFNTGQGTLADEIGRAGYTAEKIAEDWGGKLRAKAGEDAGAAAGESLNVDTKITSGMNEFTAYGQAYTNAAEAAYSARTKTDMIGTIDRLKMENETDPIAFATKAQGAMDGLVQNADPRIQPFLKLFARAQITSGQAEIAGKVHEWNLQQGAADTLDSNRQLAKAVADAAKGKTPAEVDQLVIGASDSVASEWHAMANSHAVHPIIAEKYIQEFHKELEAQISGERVGTVVEQLHNVFTANAGAGAQQFAAIMDPKNTSYTGEEKAAIGKMFEAGVNADHYIKSRLPANIAAANDVVMRLAAGEATSGLANKINRLSNQNVFTPIEQQGHLAALVRNSLDVEKKKIDFAAFDGAMDGSKPPLDPKDPDAIKVADIRFQQHATESGYATGSLQWQQMAIEVLHKSQILPTSAESWARANLAGEDPIRAANAASFFSKIKETNKVAWDYNKDPKIVAFAEQLDENLTALMPPNQAFLLAHKTVYDVKPEEQKVLDAKYKELRMPEQNASELLDALKQSDKYPSGWHPLSDNPPEIPITLQARFNSLTQQYFAWTGGDKEKTRQLAADTVKADAWGITRVNGKPELVQWAPEVTHPGYTAEVIRADIDTQLAKLGYPAEAGGTVEMVPSAATARTKGDYWQLKRTSPNGEQDMIRGADNLPVNYILPGGISFAEARLRAIKEHQDAQGEFIRQMHETATQLGPLARPPE